MFASTSTSSWRDAAQPPVTPIRSTLPLMAIPDDACPKRNSRKRAPPSPMDATFASQRREHLFTLSTACNRQLLSPSTPTAPLLPPAPIFMPLPPTPSTATAQTHSSSSLSSSPMERSPAMRTLCRFTADAFREERERSSSCSSNEDDEADRWSTRSIASSTNSLGLFDFYRDSAPMDDLFFSSPELPGSPSEDGRWSDAYESADEDSSIVFARRISFDLATPSPQSTSSLPFRTIPLPDLAAFPVTPRAPLSRDEPVSPVPSLTYSSDAHSSPASSLGDLSTSPPSSPSPSPVTACISTFETTSFFSSPSPLNSGSSLAQRRLESLQKRRAAGKQDTLRPAVVVADGLGEAFGLGLMA
ncbi:hypothetical protein JCM10213_006798 [Rhodosporidiobolus nylandii]